MSKEEGKSSHKAYDTFIPLKKKRILQTAVTVPCVNEVRWKGLGEITTGDFAVYYYSGGESAETGVAIVMHKRTVRNVKNTCAMTVQVYFPASEYEDEEVE